MERAGCCHERGRGGLLNGCGDGDLGDHGAVVECSFGLVEEGWCGV